MAITVSLDKAWGGYSFSLQINLSTGQVSVAIEPFSQLLIPQSRFRHESSLTYKPIATKPDHITSLLSTNLSWDWSNVTKVGESGCRWIEAL
jgi:hypothetical protein